MQFCPVLLFITQNAKPISRTANTTAMREQALRKGTDNVELGRWIKLLQNETWGLRKAEVSVS